MQTQRAFSRTHGASILVISVLVLLSACSAGDSATVEGDVSIAYVKRPVNSLGNPTDAAIFTEGGDLYIREKASPSAPEINVTGALTNGHGDVSDPEVSYNGDKLLFAMRCVNGASARCLNPDGTGNDTNWRIWEYNIAQKTFARIRCTAAGATPPGDDVDPAYLPDGRIVFVSNRQVQSQQVNGFAYLDEYERERVTTLHVMDGNGQNCRQISYNQSHDRNPTVLQTGEIMYSRWDHVGGRNQFSIFFTNPDGTNLFVLYGAHSPGNSYLHPREMPNGSVLSSLMPLSRTHEGGALMTIDIKNYSENCEPAPGAASGCNGQHQPTAKEVNFGRGISQHGRFSTPYPLWDGTNRALVSWTPSCAATNSCAMVVNPLTGAQEASDEDTTPVYGIHMLDLNTGNTRPVVTATIVNGRPTHSLLDPVAIQPRPTPNVITDKSLNATLAARGVGILNVKSVYDTDRQGRMGSAVLVAGESIPMVNGVPDIARLKDPTLTTAAQRPARFIRVTKAVPTRSGISREAIGETDFEMQQILGYVPIEPDGSFKVEVPADSAIALTAIDAVGRGFTPHTNWIQVRPGETRTCNGCHSPRRGNAINTGLTLSDETFAGSGVFRHRNTILDVPAIPTSNPLGQSMAETLVDLADRGNPVAAPLQPTVLKPHLQYTDVWTNPTPTTTTIDYTGVPAVPVNGVIDYPTHIQPLWTRARTGGSCDSCHSDIAALDLRGTTTGTGRLQSYDELLIGDPIMEGTPPRPRIVVRDDELVVDRAEAYVNPGSARGSHLIEVLFNQELRSARSLGVVTVNHEPMLSAQEKRLVSEWIDIGAQYYNSPLDSSNNPRGVTGLSLSAFHTASTTDRDVHAALLDRCGSCHRAVGQSGTAGTPNAALVGSRFVLTGATEGDFNVTLSMLSDVTNPPLNALLSRPASAGTSPTHGTLPGGGAILPAGDSDYNLICNWIRAGFCP